MTLSHFFTNLVRFYTDGAAPFGTALDPAKKGQLRLRNTRIYSMKSYSKSRLPVFLISKKIRETQLWWHFPFNINFIVQITLHDGSSGSKKSSCSLYAGCGGPKIVSRCHESCVVPSSAPT